MVVLVAHPCDRKLLMIRIPPQEQLNAAPVIGHAVLYHVHVICPRIFWKYFNTYFKMYVHFLSDPGIPGVRSMGPGV